MVILLNMSCRRGKRRQDRLIEYALPGNYPGPEIPFYRGLEFRIISCPSCQTGNKGAFPDLPGSSQEVGFPTYHPCFSMPEKQLHYPNLLLESGGKRENQENFVTAGGCLPARRPLLFRHPRHWTALRQCGRSPSSAWQAGTVRYRRRWSGAVRY